MKMPPASIAPWPVVNPRLAHLAMVALGFLLLAGCGKNEQASSATELEKAFQVKAAPAAGAAWGFLLRAGCKKKKRASGARKWEKVSGGRPAPPAGPAPPPATPAAPQ